jgi:hypothetical protein
MAVYFWTKTPKKLLKTFKQLIDQGHVSTWEYDKAGDFTHVNTEWAEKAWFTSEVKEDRLCFYILPPEGKLVTQRIYGTYHGRFVESLIVHCSSLFTRASAKAQPSIYDNLDGRK